MSFISREAGLQRTGRLWHTLEDLCTLLGLSSSSSVICDAVLFQRLRFKAGQGIYRVGQGFDNLYVLNTGFLKSVQFDESGNEQVLSFPMKGDLIGIDGIDSGFYMSVAVALSDCDVVALPFATLTSLGLRHPEVQNMLLRSMSRELRQRHDSIGMLVNLSAEARVALFLMSLSERFARMGYSRQDFSLRMKRQEIGSYLGLTLETVSRTLSGLAEAGLITIHQRAVSIKDFDALRSLQRMPPSHSHDRNAIHVQRKPASPL